MLELFEKYKANPDKLQTYGFKESDGVYHFSQKIMKGDFRLEVTIRDGELD
ncbi:MAG: MmcQ/YjbR family DNA-binding protein, partial [Streptococcus sanguinis]|nr:MmcQ/YjbR family DNA-binding protein [Streptococcus sanguinis]